ncbi:MAG: hypothetical protein E4G99_08245 [Anaerolineales bacterium]|nr:MAG: hypothetical protein E4G99_08245 [Anaerolineales bacterium]
MKTLLNHPKLRILAGVTAMLLFASTACTFRSLLGDPFAGPEPTGNSGIAGRIWHDRCANPPQGALLPDVYPAGCVLDPSTNNLVGNSLLDSDERGIENIELNLGKGACPGEEITRVRSAPDGMFLFAGLAAGSYCVTIDPGAPETSALLQPGRWTYPALSDSQGPMTMAVTLGEGEVRADIYFAWDFALEPAYQAPDVLTPTQDTTPSPEPTATATSEPSSTPQPTGSPTPSPSPTFTSEDPRANLGAPTWEDNMENDGDWFLYTDEHVGFEMVDGQMELSAFNPDFYSGWSLGWRRDTNMFLEATMSVLTCSGRDSIGLVFRAPDVSSGYLFGISCDGRYSLRWWDGDEMTRIQDWTSDPVLKTGSDQTQRIAVLTNGNLIQLYANGKLLKEIVDATYNEEGLLGVFISSAETPKFQARMSEFVYWNSP